MGLTFVVHRTFGASCGYPVGMLNSKMNLPPLNGQYTEIKLMQHVQEQGKIVNRSTANLYIPSSGRMLIKKCISLSFPSGKLILIFDGKFNSTMSADSKIVSRCTNLRPNLHRTHLSGCEVLLLTAFRAFLSLYWLPAAAFACPAICSQLSLASCAYLLNIFWDHTLTEKSFNILPTIPVFF